jgi:hypothetical protein
MDDERERDEEWEDDEAFLDVWREWRQGRSRDACEAKIAWMLANRSPCMRRRGAARSRARGPVEELSNSASAGRERKGRACRVHVVRTNPHRL